MLLQNIKSTSYNLRNMSKAQYNITKFITRITKNSKMNNKTFKHYKNQNNSNNNERHTFRLYTGKQVILIGNTSS